MPELERSLRALAGDLDWPATPELALRLAPRRHDLRRPLLAAVALAVVAAAIAFSVPSARSAILRFFHLGGVTVERVDTLPSARPVQLGRSLGPVVGLARATRIVDGPLRIPPALRPGPLHLDGTVVSTLLHAPEPVLLSELPSDAFILKKVAATSARLEGVTVDGFPGFWLTGPKHVIVFPDAPPRLAGNVLVWQRQSITYRLEAPHLTLEKARAIAARIDGTS